MPGDAVHGEKFISWKGVDITNQGLPPHRRAVAEPGTA
jgi:hypothetical protein